MKGGEYMGKKYNLSSKSDMRRFERDLNKSVQNMAVNALHSQAITIECPEVFLHILVLIPVHTVDDQLI